MIEIVRFLAVRAPFDALAPDELADVAAQATIEFHPAGAVIVSEDGGPVTFLRVIHSGAVDIVHRETRSATGFPTRSPRAHWS